MGAGALMALGGFGGLERALAPKPRLWAKWQAHDAAATATIDHGAWQQFLDAYVSTDAAGVARVAYGRVGASERAALQDYVGRMAATSITAVNRPEQKALWINLYNALTVDVVLAHYPVRSILDIDTSPGLLADGPWDQKLIDIEGERVSLNDIEHRILRPIFTDNRIHFVVNCASVGCPNLARHAFTAATVEAMMADAARAFVNNPRGARVDQGRLTVSKIFEWYADDFGGGEDSVAAFIESLADPPLAAAMAARRGGIKAAYDWDLNDDPPVSPARRSR
jgi:hypothetical protein